MTYFQQLTLSVSLPQIEAPAALKQIGNFFSNIITFIIENIPSVPQFDIRFQFFLLTITALFLLRVLILSFISTVITLFLNLLDTLACCLIGFAASDIIRSNSTTMSVLFIVFSLLWFFLRFTIYACRHKKKPNLVELMPKISAVHLTKTIPAIVVQDSVDDIKENIERVSKAIRIKNDGEKRSTLKLCLLLLVLLVVVGVCLGVVIGVRMEPFQQQAIVASSCFVVFIILLVLIVPF